MNRFDKRSPRAAFSAPTREMDHTELHLHASQYRAKVLGELGRELCNRIAAVLNPGGYFALPNPLT
ncbi:hypothetical protein [Tropicimonas aquimaris]|uniref:Uncharacterized protein n=1 Tax=Tropicimonas aquimaris TaxID=914152 RepID=A0ABW3ILN9_9RHOB